MNKVLFGPSGNSISFYEEGFTSTMQTPKWLSERGLDAFEYSFGQGYRMTSATAQKLGEEFKKYGIKVSFHAPFFINFANPSEEMYAKSTGYLATGVKLMKTFGADRLVFHTASCGKQARQDAIALAESRLKEIMPKFEEELGESMYLCPETMGKLMQIGTYQEVIDLCTISPKLLPTFDFGHINALSQGGLKTSDDYKRVFDYSIEKLGFERTKIAHIHFSKIQYGAKGEIKHLTFADEVYGPLFEDLAQVLIDYKLECRVICESAGTMAEDSKTMKDIYEKTLALR